MKKKHRIRNAKAAYAIRQGILHAKAGFVHPMVDIPVEYSRNFHAAWMRTNSRRMLELALEMLGTTRKEQFERMREVEALEKLLEDSTDG